MISERKQISILYYLGLTAFLVIILGPFVYMVLTSLAKDPAFLLPGKPLLFTLSHFQDLLTVPSLHFLYYLRNSFLLAGITAASCVFIGCLAAYAITRSSSVWPQFLLLAILAVSLFPQISLLGFLYKLFSELHLTNSMLTLILPYIAWTLPLSIWILTSYFSRIPQELDEVAFLDGCPRWTILTKIILPIAFPGLFSTFLLAFVFAFNELLFALLLTTDFHTRTIPVGLALFQGLHGEIPWGHIMAAATLATIPLILMVLYFQRRLLDGLLQGAVKE